EGEAPLTMALAGKVAIVTGGTKGIGRGIAEALVPEGVDVCTCARSRKEVDDAVRELVARGTSRVAGIVCDVRIQSQIKSLFDFAELELGGIDILINNAGIGIF